MKTREDILKTLTDLFLASQNSVSHVPEGSVLRSILFAAASEMEEVYKQIDESLNKLYVNEASGEYLDSLIQGLVGLERLKAKRSLGYVILEFGEPLTSTNINKLSFSFSAYSTSGAESLEAEFPGTVVIPISPSPGNNFSLTIIAPQSVNAEARDYEIDQATGLQRLFTQFRDYLLSIYNTTGKPVRYAILPVVTVETGSKYIVDPGELNYTTNLGVPVIISNVYLRQNAKLNQFSLADPDGIHTAQVSPVPDSIYIGEASRIKGGRDDESDEEYRKRYYLYLSSLSKGTERAIELGITSEFPSIDVRSISTSKKGEVDIVLFSQKPVTPNIVTKIYDVLKDYRPAGIKINIFSAKTVPIVVLFDGESKELRIAAEKSKNILQNLLDNKDIGETLTYTEIHESLDIPELVQIINVFYGMYLTKDLFDLYSSTFSSVYQELIPSLSPPFTYQDVYDKIINHPEDVILFDASRAYNGYPLIEFVREAKKVPDPTQLPSPLDTKVSAIQACPAGVRDIDCLETLASSHPTLTVTLDDIIQLLGPEYGVYYRMKLVAVPNVLHLSSAVAEPLITDVLRTDVLLLNNKQKRAISPSGMEKLILAYDELINGNVYKNSSAVGVRKYEPVD